MEKLDVKDRRILYTLDLNSRQSFSQIGKKVGMHKDVVAYRVNKLQERGLIKNFIPITNSSLLGYSWYRFYFTFQYTSPEMIDEIIDYFINVKYTHTVCLLDGQYDLLINTYVKDENKAYHVWENILSKYRDYFAQQVFSVVYTSYGYRYSFLLEGTDEENPKNVKAMVCGNKNNIEIDEIDHKIIKLLYSNARTPTINIAKELNIATTTVRYRIKKLMDLGIIKGFRILLDLPKLGYNLYKCDIILKDHNQINKIIKYIENHPYIQGIQRSIGYVDLELAFYLKNANQLYNIMKDLSLKFPNSIKHYKYFSVIKTSKWGLFSEE
ncbi:MAG: AsnC family transcriptional regulator [Thermoplasmatales archaeon]|nr:MAG: AsnC family transcriptional regulator [Thermoplasmatales archaeon]